MGTYRNITNAVYRKQLLFKQYQSYTARVVTVEVSMSYYSITVQVRWLKQLSPVIYMKTVHPRR